MCLLLRRVIGFFAYELHANMPHMLRLALHTNDRQPVYFSEQDDFEDVMSTPVKNTTLTGWFLANQILPTAKDVTYTNFHDKFVWDISKHEWKVRVKSNGTMIGRMYAAHTGEGERFYMRMILNHVTGYTRYVDIRTLADGTSAVAIRRPLADVVFWKMTGNWTSV